MDRDTTWVYMTYGSPSSTAASSPRPPSSNSWVGGTLVDTTTLFIPDGAGQEGEEVYLGWFPQFSGCVTSRSALESETYSHSQVEAATVVGAATPVGAQPPIRVPPQAFCHPVTAAMIDASKAEDPDQLVQRPSRQPKVPGEKGRHLYPCDRPGCSALKPMKLSALIQHQRTHTGEKPEVCGYCLMAFPKKSNLVRHFKTCKSKKACDLTLPSPPASTGPTSMITHDNIHYYC